jgi:hypothetical protein
VNTSLQSPTPLLRLMMQQSNCFRVVGSVGALEQERRRTGNSGRVQAADYVIEPNIVFSNPNAGGYGGLGGLGGVFGLPGLIIGTVAASIKIQEAQTSLFATEVRTGVQVAAADGSAKVSDFGGLGGLGGFGGGIGGFGGIGGYGNTAEGKLIAAAFLDAHNKLVAQMGGSSGRAGMALVRNEGMNDPALVRETQRELRRLGYYQNEVDGRYGPGTRAAIIRYQQENGHDTDGQPSDALIAELRSR